ncbi:MAG: glycoside hydrolase family 95 protein, partial [Lentisphaerae bacterium]
LWDGHYQNTNNPKALQALPAVRKLIFEGKYNEAERLAAATMLGVPPRIKSYQTLGDLFFDFPATKTVAGYRRQLDLNTAITRVQYTIDDITYVREVFASAPDQVIVVHISANRPASIRFTAWFQRNGAQTVAGPENALILRGKLSLSYEARLIPIVHGGQVSTNNAKLHVQNADEVTLLISAATSYVAPRHIAADPALRCQTILARARRKTYRQLKEAHLADYQPLFSRVSLDLGGNDAANRPTDERLKTFRKGKHDPQLIALYFQFGRYLLISSSRPGSLPANLQGKWCQHYKAPWNSDYHTNINLQMNYWPALSCNLAECHLPLFTYMETLVPFGEQTAKIHYGARGWVLHHLSNIFGFTTPADGVWGIWPMGAAWLSRDIMEFYRFTGDRRFLKRYYPVLKKAARFILDFLVTAPSHTPVAGKLVTNPSYSPENSFYTPTGKRARLSYAASMDLEIIHDLFHNVIEAQQALQLNSPSEKSFAREIQTAIQNLAPLQISPKTGRLQEWIEDYREYDPHHRHVSHLFALHPGQQITPIRTPKLFIAAKKSLIARGDGGTGWSMAWKINFWARLHDGNHAYKLLQNLLSRCTLN